MDTEGPLGDCLCTTNQAAWNEGRGGGWVVEDVRDSREHGFHRGHTDACMDHLKGVQGPRSRHGF